MRLGRLDQMPGSLCRGSLSIIQFASVISLAKESPSLAIGLLHEVDSTPAWHVCLTLESNTVTAQSIFDQLIASAAATGEQQRSLAESSMGLFHAFRPDGLRDHAFLDNVPGGSAFRDRLNSVFAAVGDGRRADGMKDAYFIVRNPPHLSLQRAETLTHQFVSSALKTSGHGELQPALRLLEGKAPKAPRRPDEQCTLMKQLCNEIPSNLAARHRENSLGHLLSESLYFLACDQWLCEYVRQPLLDSEADADAELCAEAYFELWRHGVKFRIFNDREVAFYLPRRTDGTLIQAGQFARP